MRPHALLVLALAASTLGCLGSAPAEDDEAPIDAPAPKVAAGPILERKSCFAVNAFGGVAESDLRPFVPENWTFTTATQGRAVLRMFVITCADASTVMLSTPVVPDEASAVHSENPDHVIEVFASDEAEVARWVALGIPASLATIARDLSPPYDIFTVDTEAGTSFAIQMLPAAVPTPTGYEWQAVYSSGVADPLVWFWGDEVSPSTGMTRFTSATLGPGSLLEGTAVQPGNAAQWASFDITYEPGLPG